jgi:transcription elongation factor Elf1
MEIPVRGTLVNVTERPNYVDYLLKINRITPAEHTMCMKAVEFSRSQQDSVEYQTYQFERIAMVLRLLCKNYGIEMRWTPNLSATAVDYYNRWMDVFLRQVSFMADTCAGVGVLRDFATPEDGSTGLLTQASIAEVLMSSDGRNSLEAINAQLTANHNFLVHAEPVHYEKVISAARN